MSSFSEYVWKDLARSAIEAYRERTAEVAAGLHDIAEAVRTPREADRREERGRA